MKESETLYEYYFHEFEVRSKNVVLEITDLPISPSFSGTFVGGIGRGDGFIFSVDLSVKKNDWNFDKIEAITHKHHIKPHSLMLVGTKSDLLGENEASKENLIIAEFEKSYNIH